MSERKVLNKYYPPDFDVTKLPKLKLHRERQFVIRIMAPFSMRCKTCGDYIYKGRKFNSRMETIKDETYLGLRKYRFYIKCPKCLSEITFKTDPEKTDYEMEHGATRNFQAHKFATEEESRLKAEKEEEELNNPMKALENRTKESKLEMSRLEDLEDIKEINKRYAVIDHDSLLKRHVKLEEEILAQQEAEDEEMIRQAFGKEKDGDYFKRLSDSDSDDDSKRRHSQAQNAKRTATDLLTTDVTEPDVKKQKFSKPGTRDRLTSSLAGLKQMVRSKKPSCEKTDSLDASKESSSCLSSHGSKSSGDAASLPAQKDLPSAEKNYGETSSSVLKTSLTLLGSYDSSSEGSADD